MKKYFGSWAYWEVDNMRGGYVLKAVDELSQCSFDLARALFAVGFQAVSDLIIFKIGVDVLDKLFALLFNFLKRDVFIQQSWLVVAKTVA